jgi:hypothetical protein
MGAKLQKKRKLLYAAVNFSLFTLHFSLKNITFAADKTKNFIFLDL